MYEIYVKLYEMYKNICGPHGPRPPGPWPLANEPQPMAPGPPWTPAHGPWPTAPGPQPPAHSPWPTAPGPSPWPLTHSSQRMAPSPQPLAQQTQENHARNMYRNLIKVFENTMNSAFGLVRFYMGTPQTTFIVSTIALISFPSSSLILGHLKLSNGNGSFA